MYLQYFYLSRYYLSFFVLLLYFFMFLMSFLLFFFFFFFQAEDGIRDWSVTGVQTCALPISRKTGWRRCNGAAARRSGQRQRSGESRSLRKARSPHPAGCRSPAAAVVCRPRAPRLRDGREWPCRRPVRASPRACTCALLRHIRQTARQRRSRPRRRREARQKTGRAVRTPGRARDRDAAP